ncbi:MAG TPA: GNAT family N-acetyltransferase [Tepidisphaeraceae bacterium]|jgi:ribosomal protein S18 acetylase RimI-like enzyme
MSYSIDISEVGPAEYPLIKVLRDTIFEEYSHRFSTSFEEIIEDKRDVLALIAHLEGNPVGYKLGYRERPGHYHSWTGGVLKEYRGQGIAARMQAWQHAWLRARGYRSVSFNSFNKFRQMLQFGLASGFVPDGVNVRPEGELAIHFVKDLSQPDSPPREKRPALEVHVESVGPNYHGLIAQLASETVEPVSEPDIDREMAGQNALALVAFADGRPVGFKIGRGREGRRRLFTSRLGGVMNEYRGRGVASALARHQIRAVAGMGYPAIRCHVKNDNVPMLRMALHEGFGIIGMIFHEGRKMALVGLERPIDPERDRG